MWLCRCGYKRRLTVIKSNTFNKKEKNKSSRKKSCPQAIVILLQNKTSIQHVVRPVPLTHTHTHIHVYLYKSVIVPFPSIVGHCASSEHDRGKRRLEIPRQEISRACFPRVTSNLRADRLIA